MGNDIHPAPAEFTGQQIILDPILHFFHYRHLPPALQEISQMFCVMAQFVVDNLPRNPERTVALRKLLEAKDCAVRANLPTPGAKQKDLMDELQQNGTREIGGFDEDRSGPVPFK